MIKGNQLFRTLSLLLSLFLVLVSTCPAHAVITVTGSATAALPADGWQVTFTILSEHPLSPAIASAANEQAWNDARTALIASGIPGDSVETLSLGAVYKPPPIDQPVVTGGWTVVRRGRVLFRGATAPPELTAAARALRSEGLHNTMQVLPVFIDEEAALVALRRRATENAFKRATHYADMLGQKLTTPTGATEALMPVKVEGDLTRTVTVTIGWSHVNK